MSKTTTKSTETPKTPKTNEGQWELAKDSGSTTLVLSGEDGKTMIMETVVAKIAGLAIREIDGVHSLVPFNTAQRLTSLAKSLSKTDMRDLGVQVEIGTIEAAVDVRIIADYGSSIPEICANIRNNVSQRVQNMTGLTVKEINIDIVDLYFDQPEPAPAPADRATPKRRILK